MASTITKMERALEEHDLALLAGETDVAYAWNQVAAALGEQLQREADTAARNMARVTGSSSARYEITHTDGSVAVTGSWSR